MPAVTDAAPRPMATASLRVVGRARRIVSPTEATDEFGVRSSESHRRCELDDAVGHREQRRPVRDHHHGSSGREPSQRFGDSCLGGAVEVGGGFVEQDERRRRGRTPARGRLVAVRRPTVRRRARRAGSPAPPAARPRGRRVTRGRGHARARRRWRRDGRGASSRRSCLRRDEGAGASTRCAHATHPDRASRHQPRRRAAIRPGARGSRAAASTPSTCRSRSARRARRLHQARSSATTRRAPDRARSG